MKKKILLVITTVCLLLIGCKGSQANRTAFLEEYIIVADEIVRIVDGNPTAEGVNQAQSYLNSKKASLKSKFDAGKQETFDQEMQEKFNVIVTGQISKVVKLLGKYPNLSKLKELNDDFSMFLMK